MDTHTNYISLYTGAGGLDLGFKLAVPSARTICYVERDAAASALLVDHMQANQLDDAPLWSDSATFDCKPWIGSVDFIIGGFPCQPWSAAGKRKGTEDERWLWPHIFRLVREIRPSGVFLENVTGLLSGGIEHVLGDLAAIGYDAEWTSIRASDIGAPHRRARVFILGKPRSSRLSTRRHREREYEVHHPKEWSTTEIEQQWRVGQPGSSEGSEALVNSRSEGSQGSHDHGESSDRLQQSASERCGYVDESSSNERQRQVQEHADRSIPPIESRSSVVNASSERRWTQSNGEQWASGFDWGCRPLPWPPNPDSVEWGRILETRPDLAPAQPEVRGMADGMAGGLARANRLRILGNGVVPQQAAFAFALLNDRFI